MSDRDDLQRLEQRLKDGEITREEYESERAWITGSTAKETTRSSTGHVIDLHEIEEDEQPARDAAASKAKQDRPRRQIPTVWKVILVAFVVWILLIVTAVVWLRLQQNRQQTAQQTAGVQTQQGSETAQNAASDLQDNAAEATYEAFTAQLETTLATYYGDNYTINDDGKTLTISLMGEGIAADAMYVVEGVDGAAEIWNELKASMQSLAITCFDGANADAPERHVVLNILNDQNAENVILSYLDGQCIYDATESPAAEVTTETTTE